MESHFGEYITKEYGLLKQILSNLKPCDLRNAKLVCSDWCTAVESLLDKNPKWLTSHENVNTVLCKPMIPSLVIYNDAELSGSCLKKCKICKKASLLCPCIINGDNTVFVSLDSKFHHNLSLGSLSSTSSYMFWQSFSALLFPSSPKIHVSTFIIEPKSSIIHEPISDTVVNLCTGGHEPIKCLLIICKSRNKFLLETRWLNKLLNMIVDRQGMTFAVGGGDIRGVVCKRGFNITEEKWKIPTMILITLRGEGVTAHSDILSGFNEKKVEDFMQEFSRRVGPLPEAASRIAFIAQCVDRTEKTIEGCESAAFKKVFPLVPQFGYRAYGEYGMRCQSSDDVETKFFSKRMKMSFNHTSTSSIVILTFNRI